MLAIGADVAVLCATSCAEIGNSEKSAAELIFFLIGREIRDREVRCPEMIARLVRGTVYDPLMLSAIFGVARPLAPLAVQP
jgi:hypothetical protein